jgi:hypothetical protein
MSGYRTIKELVIDTCKFPSYERLTSLIKANFPNSKWKESHYNWYKSQIRTGKIKVPGVERNVKENKMWEVKDDVIIETTRIGLLKDKYWRYLLKDYPIELLCAIRNGLKKSSPLLAEKFNPTTPGLLYFGYKVRNRDAAKNDFSKRSYGPDKAYIYIQKKNLRIDLDIRKLDIVSKFEQKLVKAGYEVRPSNNYQGRAGWLTGWYVPQSTTDVKTVLKWLCKVFEQE